MSAGFPDIGVGSSRYWGGGATPSAPGARADATPTLLCKLDPAPYVITGPDGYELSDRWEEAQTMMRDIRQLWNRLEAEGS